MDNLLQESVYGKLRSSYGYIIEQLEAAFLSQHRCSKESELYLNFHDMLIDRVEKFMRIYKLPENVDEHFNLIRGFITQFRTTVFYEGLVKNCYTKTNRQFERFINIVSEEDKSRYKIGITADQLAMDLDIEEEIIQLDMQARINKAFNQFSTYLNPMEKLFFRGMVNGDYTSDIIRRIGNSGFIPPSGDAGQRIRNTIEFRLTCFFAQDNYPLFDKSLVLRALNKFSKLNRRVFGEARLVEIPKQENLEKAIKGKFLERKSHSDEIGKITLVKQYDQEAKILEHGKKTFAKSKVDFNGDPHKHWVVYINHGLHCYCHVTGKSWKLAG